LHPKVFLWFNEVMPHVAAHTGDRQMNIGEKIETAIVALAVFAVGVVVMVGPWVLYVKGVI
jgi:uncharacterized membrane protein YfbV (UPF0208 family)